MNQPNLKVASVLIVLILTVMLLSIAAKPRPAPLPAPAPQQQSAQPKITWSVPQLSETLFPGTSKTITIRFRSSQNLGSVAFWSTPSLDGIVSTNPSSFPLVTANRDYEVAVAVSTPPEFKKRTFGGTIHLRNDGKLPRTFAEPLPIVLRAEFGTYRNDSLGFSLFYPTELTPVNEGGVVIFFFPNDDQPPLFEVETFQAIPLVSTNTKDRLIQIAQSELGRDFVAVERFTGKGIIVSARTNYMLHYFTSNETSNRAAEIRASSPDFFNKEAFSAISAGLTLF